MLSLSLLLWLLCGLSSCGSLSGSNLFAGIVDEVCYESDTTDEGDSRQAEDPYGLWEKYLQICGEVLGNTGLYKFVNKLKLK